MVFNDLLTVPDDSYLEEIRTEAFARAMVGDVKSLLTLPNKNAKLKKSLSIGVYTGMLSFAPANSSGINVCPAMSKGCQAACLFKAGCGRYTMVRVGRMRRTYQYLFRQTEFLAQLVKEIGSLVRKAAKLGMIPAIRLNGMSDIAWETIPVDGYANIFERFPNVAFYDYTKRFDRLQLDIKNYHLTFSRSETKLSQKQADQALAMGIPVTVVFKKQLPKTYKGKNVIDGDKHDYRVWDSGNVIGLKFKGSIKDREEAIENGFCVVP
jgi:hypothetical protein